MKLAIAVMLAVATFAACSGDDGGDSAGTTTTTVSDPEQRREQTGEDLDEYMSQPDATPEELAATCRSQFGAEDTANWENAPPGLTADDLCAGIEGSYGDETCIWQTVEECVLDWITDEFSRRFD